MLKMKAKKININNFQTNCRKNRNERDHKNQKKGVQEGANNLNSFKKKKKKEGKKKKENLT